MKVYTCGHEVSLKDADLRLGSMYEYVGTRDELLELSKTTSVYILRCKSTECFFQGQDEEVKFAIVKDGQATPYMWIADIMRTELELWKAIPRFVIEDNDDDEEPTGEKIDWFVKVKHSYGDTWLSVVTFEDMYLMAQDYDWFNKNDYVFLCRAENSDKAHAYLDGVFGKFSDDPQRRDYDKTIDYLIKRDKEVGGDVWRRLDTYLEP